MGSPLLDYCGRVEIVHLPDRTDRYWRLARELAGLGIAMTDSRVRIPHAPRPEGANGFTDRGVHGNFLSHLDILKRASSDGLAAAWVLEDDAIFRTRLLDLDNQTRIVSQLSTDSWDLCYLGHPISKLMTNRPTGLIACELVFKWSHCYLVSKKFLPELVLYLEQVLQRPEGHPQGGRMYFDGALSHIRLMRPEIRTLVYNPALSVQAGSLSNLGQNRWYDGLTHFHRLAGHARDARDRIWRRTGYHWPGPRD